MSSLAKLARVLRVRPTASLAVGVQRNSKVWHSTVSFNGGDGDGKNGEGEESDKDLVAEKPESKLQGVDPRKGWGFRGVHKAIICGKVGQAPVQKILRNGRTVTIFSVGTGGMFDQRIVGKDLPKPAQWHRIAVHNEPLGAYAVQQLVKNSPVYVEGDIEVRVYNDSVNGEVKHVPEICIRRDGRIRLIKTGESISNISVDELPVGWGNNDFTSCTPERDCLINWHIVEIILLIKEEKLKP